MTSDSTTTRFSRLPTYTLPLLLSVAGMTSVRLRRLARSVVHLGCGHSVRRLPVRAAGSPSSFAPVARAFRPGRRHTTTIVHASMLALRSYHVAMARLHCLHVDVLEFKGFSPE
jgi:hypothetical protein